jgi:hypothetical protein
MPEEDTELGTAPPLGWYPDPEIEGSLRWWDGTAWTEHRALAEGSTTSPPNLEPVAPPGWYADPTVDGYLRWWDGTAWSDQRHPAITESGRAQSMSEPPDRSPDNQPPDAFPSDIDPSRLAEALTLTDRGLRRLMRAVNEGRNQDSEEFQIEVWRVKRQLRANRELREGNGGE